jgi:hypothetical protein
VPDDFIGRLAALVPKPRAHLANPASPHGAASAADGSPNLTWAQRLQRVFAIDLDKSAGLPICTAEGRREAVGHRDVPDETCRQCRGRLRVIASIEQPALIERILGHLGRAAGAVDPAHPSRAPPGRSRRI